MDDGERRGGTGSISDMMKKALAAGIGAVFMTEESLRTYLSEARLPREIAKALLQQSAQAKEQVLQFLSREVSGLIRKTDLNRLLLRILEGHEIEVHARVRFRRVPDGLGGLVVRAMTEASGKTARSDAEGPDQSGAQPREEPASSDSAAQDDGAEPDPAGAGA